MSALILIASAFFHALWNAIAKRDRDIDTDLMGILVIAAVFGLILLPIFGAPFLPPADSIPWAIGAGVFEAGYMLTLARALKGATLGAAYIIMRGGAMVIVWFFSTLLLSEPFHWITASGVLAVGLGMTLVHLSWKTSSAKSSKASSREGLIWAFACAMFIAGYHLCYGQALEREALPPSLFALSLWISTPIYMVLSGKALVLKFLKKCVSKPGNMWIGGFFCALSFTLFLYGLSDSGAGFAITLRNTSIVFAQIFSLALGEKVSARQWFGAVLVLGGATLLSAYG